MLYRLTRERIVIVMNTMRYPYQILSDIRVDELFPFSPLPFSHIFSIDIYNLNQRYPQYDRTDTLRYIIAKDRLD